MTGLMKFENNVVTMSSREIAELTSKDHKHVIRDIRSMIAELKKDGPVLDHVIEYKDSRGYTSEFLLKRREVEILLTGYSTPLRAKVIDRLHELEQNETKVRVQLPDFTDPAEAAIAWAKEYKEKQLALVQLKEKDEQIETMEAFFKEGMTPRDFCKGLNGVNLNKINRSLEDMGWIYDTDNGWKVYALVRDKYLTEHVDSVTIGAIQKSQFKPVVLKEGAKKLFSYYIDNKLPMKKTCDGSYTHDKFEG